ncbi:MAG: hypothetical protein HC767_08750 [Akkermansiaceae bacterium]|nr:hypothetical protein [Akkermansiaceae bacterium]
MPLASLALVIAWNSHQAISIRSLREESRELEKRIATVSTASDQENESTKFSIKKIHRRVLSIGSSWLVL